MSASVPPPPLTYDVSTLLSDDFFGFWPSLALAIVAMVLYLLAAAVILFITVRFQGRRSYMHTVSVTGLIEAAGYAAIVYLTVQSGKTDIYGAYVVSQVFIILSPNLLQGTDYWTVGKVLQLSGLAKNRKLLQKKAITGIFVTADLVALFVQAAGISLWASSKGSGNPNKNIINLGNYITLAGLAFQLCAFGVFVILAVWTHRHPGNKLKDHPGFGRLFRGLYLTIFFITLRNVYRLAEFAQQAALSFPEPDNTFILAHSQALFYCLDALPILLAFLTFIVYHPSRLMFGHDAPLPPTDVESPTVTTETEVTVDGAKTP